MKLKLTQMPTEPVTEPLTEQEREQYAREEHEHELFERFNKRIDYRTDPMILTSWLEKHSQADIKRLKEHFDFLSYWAGLLIKDDENEDK